MPEHDRLGQKRIAVPHHRMAGDRRVPHRSTDNKAAVRPLLDPVQGQPGHIDQRVRLFDVLAHQIDKVRAAAEELRIRRLGEELNRGFQICCSRIGEALHFATSRSNALWIASQMPT